MPEQITCWSAADLEIDADSVGANSRTKTISVAPPAKRKEGQIIEGETPEEIADKLFAKLREDQII